MRISAHRDHRNQCIAITEAGRSRSAVRSIPSADHRADPQQQIAARSPSLLIAHNDAHTMPRMAHRHCALLAAVALSGACATTGGESPCTMFSHST
jgi:hypothetical protein